MPDTRQSETHQPSAAEMSRLLRDALAHLYDVAHLQTNALGDMLALDTSDGAVSRGQALRRLLLDTLELMRPGEQVPYGDKAWRPYCVLLHRYAQRMSVLETQSELGISERQLQREHAQALRIMGNLIEPHLACSSDDQEPHAEVYQDPLDAAIARFLAGARPEPLALDELANSVRADLSSMAEDRQVALEIDACAELEPLYGDRGVLRQILMSVMSQALLASRDDTITMTLKTTPRDAVISLGAMNRTLETCKPSERLALAERMTSAIGGSLSLARGDIKVRLPLSRRIILVADDNRDIVDMLGRFLADGRYKVIGAYTGQRAIELAEELDPHLILLDVMMPGQDGWETLQHLKHGPTTARIPVVICSILPEQQLAKSLGADGYLAKPVTQQSLLSLLSELVEQTPERS